MSMHVNPSRPFRFTGKHMLMSMACFFGVIIAVNVTMATLASKSWTGLVVRNSYVASQQFNAQLADARAQHESGIQSEISYRHGQLYLEVKDQDGRTLPVSGLAISIGRPVFEQSDRTIEVTAENRVSHNITLNLEPGIWAISVTGETNLTHYRRDVRLLVDQYGQGVIE